VEPERLELYVARSYSSYLHAWLLDAAAEFGE
jgi:sarcosine oxidase gamma subunit